MIAFLRQTCELWYWSLFCPTRLQQRRNAWAARSGAGRRPRALTLHLLLLRANGRFLAQFALLTIIMTLPLGLLVPLVSAPSDWLLAVVAALAAYGVAVVFLPLGIHLPLLFALIYLYRADAIGGDINWLAQSLALLPQNIVDATVAAALLILFALLGNFLLNRERGRIAWIITIGGIPASVAAAGLQSSSSIFLVAGSIGLTAMIAIVYWHRVGSSHGLLHVISAGITIGLVGGLAARAMAGAPAAAAFVTTYALVFAISIVGAFLAAAMFAAAAAAAFTLALVFAALVAGVLAWFVGVALGIAVDDQLRIAASATVPLPALTLFAWLVGSLLAPGRWRWGGLLLAAALTAALAQAHGWLAIAPGLAALIGYYRIAPGYPGMAILSQIFAWTTRRRPGRAARRLRWLPPHSSELAWLPLPGHAELLAAGFRAEPAMALETLQDMRGLALPGYRRTIARALPLIVAEQLAAAETLTDLFATTTPTHPILPLLVPAFYTPTVDQPTPERLPALPEQDEITTMLARLYSIVRQLSIVHELPESGIRGLEHSLANMQSLADQLPGLGLDKTAQQRWLPVLERWRQIVQHEIVSRGGIGNPFLPGRVLTVDHDRLFKGRRGLAGTLYQHLISRGRPTMLLYGPRRCGKSSFLRHLPRLLPDTVVPVFLDLQGDGTTDSDANLCFSLARAIHQNPGIRELALPEPVRDHFQANPRALLSDWLEQVWPRLERRDLLICLDEIEALGQAIAERRITLTMLGALRSLIQHKPRLNFLLCGAETLHQLTFYWSGYFINIVPIEILYLSEEHARELICEPDEIFAREVRYDPGVVEHILQRTRCHPYFLQLMGDALATLSNRQQTTRITRALAEAAEEIALTPDNQYMKELWKSFQSTKWTTENSWAEMLAGQDLMQAIARGQPLAEPAAEEAQALQASALQRLKDLHVIEQVEGKYRFEVPLVARWVRERAIPDPKQPPDSYVGRQPA